MDPNNSIRSVRPPMDQAEPIRHENSQLSCWKITAVIFGVLAVLNRYSFSSALAERTVAIPTFEELSKCVNWKQEMLLVDKVLDIGISYEDAYKKIILTLETEFKEANDHVDFVDDELLHCTKNTSTAANCATEYLETKIAEKVVDIIKKKIDKNHAQISKNKNNMDIAYSCYDLVEKRKPKNCEQERKYNK